MVDKEKKMIFGIGIVFLFLATVTFSYAYFTTTLVNNNVKDQVVQTGTLELTYTDGPEIVMNNIKPGTTITKEISVKNTGTLDTSYNLVWKKLINEIINDEMVIEATCTRLNSSGVEEGTCESLSSTPIKRIKIKENVSIEANITHKYNITITFKETNAEQNYNQGKKFTGTLGINEYVDNTPIYCTFDGEMVQGAEYVNGQYTYRYMQEGDYSESGLAWTNISDDGWGVQLTDKTSTDPVTSKLCTYINNKPVVSMSFMFAGSDATTIDLSSFNTSNVTNMSDMFGGDSSATTLDLSSFNTSKVNNMKSMFYGSSATFLDLSNFDTSNVTNMNWMFSESAATTLDLSSFDTSKVTDMSYMFFGSSATFLDLSNFNTSSVTNMSYMFSGSAATTLDLSNFNTSNVTDMSYMLYSSLAVTLDLSSFNTSKVTDMSWMFAETVATIINLSNFDTSNVTDMSHMFSWTKFKNIDLSSFNTIKVTNMRDMFFKSLATTMDLSSFNTSNVIEMEFMFNSCGNLKAIYASDNFSTNAVTLANNMFTGSSNLVGGAGTTYNSSFVDKTYARIDGGTSSPGYFTLKNN